MRELSYIYPGENLDGEDDDARLWSRVLEKSLIGCYNKHREHCVWSELKLDQLLQRWDYYSNVIVEWWKNDICFNSGFTIKGTEYVEMLELSTRNQNSNDVLPNPATVVFFLLPTILSCVCLLVRPNSRKSAQSLFLGRDLWKIRRTCSIPSS